MSFQTSLNLLLLVNTKDVFNNVSVFLLVNMKVIGFNVVLGRIDFQNNLFYV